MAPRQLSMSNIADSDVLLGSVPCFLSRLPANGPTARPLGTTLQVLDLSSLHSITRVPFLYFHVVSASIPSSSRSSHPSAQRSRLSCFRRPIATGIP